MGRLKQPIHKTNGKYRPRVEKAPRVNPYNSEITQPTGIPAPPRKNFMFSEIGETGIQISAGRVYEERVKLLLQERGRLVFYEMSENDATISALLYLVESMLRAMDWKFESKDQEEDASETEKEDAIEFCRGVFFEDMDTTWDDFISDALSLLVFGWSWFETVYKIRGGPDRIDPKFNSNFTDGKIGIKRFGHRSQLSLWKWDLASNGDIIAMVQQPPWGRGIHTIPRNKSIHFKTKNAKGNPEGKSLLRGAWRAWYYLNHAERQEAIALERDLNGLPVIGLPMELLNSEDSADVAAVNEYIKMGRDIKLNEQSSAILPSDPFYDAMGNPTNMKQITFELMSSSGNSKLQNTTEIKKSYKEDISRSILAQFLMMNRTGSFARSESESDLFLMSLLALAENIGQTFSKDAINPLWKLNNMPLDSRPVLVPGKLRKEKVQELGEFVERMFRSGVFMFDPNLEAYLREKAGLPEPDIGYREAIDDPANQLIQEEDNAASRQVASNPTS